jgi:hypothetical protein
MKRPMHWYWAAAISFVAAYGVLILWTWLCIRGQLWDQNNAPLEPAYRGCFEFVRRIAPRGAAHFVGVWFDIPFFAAALVTYELLRRPARHEPLRCLKCGYILKGLSEPRCPECGERI